MSDKPHPPYPPMPPYPPQAPAPQMPPRPAGVPQMGQPPRPGMPPAGGYPIPPGGMKMPPRPGMPPMGGYPIPPGGMKMPPRPMGMPPAGGALPPSAVPPATVEYPQPPVSLPVPGLSSDVSEEEVDEMWGEEEQETPAAAEEVPEEPAVQEEEFEVGEDGIIDDLAEEPEETEQPQDDEEDARFEASPYDDNLAADLGLPPAFIRTKVLLFIFVLFALLGGGVGFFFGMSQNQGKDEMPGVVNNAEIPKGRPRCGIAQKGQGCVLYLMNAQRREMEAKEFFGYAADILGIPKFQIETANIRYATMRIPPGYIALFNIPPVQ